MSKSMGERQEEGGLIETGAEGVKVEKRGKRVKKKTRKGHWRL